MPKRPPIHKPLSCKTPEERRRDSDKKRQSSTQRGYGYKWQKARAAYLKEYPLCVKCNATADISVATEIDHIEPHRGNQSLFWDSSNWQALCKPCHSKKTATEDGGGWQ